jgi:hypothetical protein
MLPLILILFILILIGKLVEHDVCITYFSGIGIEAFAIGCEVIALNITGKEWSFRLGDIGIADEATSVQELSAALEKIIDKKSKTNLDLINTPKELMIFRDGLAIDRIRSIIKNNLRPVSKIEHLKRIFSI